jgi:PAS domain S-box-containing protein
MGQIKDLKQRAEVVFNSNINEYIFQDKRDSDFNKNLKLYEIELELQNEDLRNTQLALEEANQKYIHLYELAPVGYFTLNQNGIIMEVNEAGAQLLGMKKYNVLNKSFSRYVAADSQDMFITYQKNLFEDVSLQMIEIKLLKKGGQIFHAQLNSRAILNPLTNSNELLTFVTDITSRKENEIHLQQYQQKVSSQDRYNSLNELSSVISHELNHPLGVIANYLQGCIRRLESGKFKIAELLAALKSATQQSHRAAEIILRMKNLKYKGAVSKETICIDSMMDETIMLIKYEIIDFPVSVHYRPLHQSLNITLDKVQIQQVILNLARNAIEAMRDANVSHPRLIIEINQFSIDTIEINIIDNGPGFSQEISHKLFDPHFTTKPYGIGLGLAVSRSVVEAHGGSLLIKSNQLGGVCATFTLSLQS